MLKFGDEFNRGDADDGRGEVWRDGVDGFEDDDDG